MKMKSMVAAMTAVAVSAVSFAAMSFSASAADVIGVAVLNGQMGTYSQWDQTGSAQITGDGQYEVTWDITGDGTGTIEFLLLEIQGADPTNEDLKNFTADQYPDVSITIDEITIDGSVFNYTANDGSTVLNHYEGDSGRVRVYLCNTWGVNSVPDLGVQSAVTQQIKVKFTLSGLPAEEATEDTTEAPIEETTAADTTAADGTTAAAADGTTAASTTAAGSTTAATTKAATTTTTNADTSDNGIAVVLAGMAAAGAVAIVSKKRK